MIILFKNFETNFNFFLYNYNCINFNLELIFIEKEIILYTYIMYNIFFLRFNNRY